MADLIAAVVVADQTTKKKTEKFGEIGNGSATGFVLGVIIMGIAAYLSWQCNTQAGTNTLLKIVYAVVAALFGFSYLWYYVIWHKVLTAGHYCHNWDEMFKQQVT